MSKLTKSQIQFLNDQGIPLEKVFDAHGVRTRGQIQEILEEDDLHFYFGHSACQRWGHTLRSKAGHCIQCDTSRIAFQLRRSDSGLVYLAYSKRDNLVKVGFAKQSPQQRADSLNKQRYANVTDWRMIKSAQFDENAGKREFAIQSELAPFKKVICYERTPGWFVECREVFSCGLKLAENTFDRHALQ